MRQHLERINGVEVYFDSYINNHIENKPVLVFVHGFLSSSFSFRKLIPFLLNHFSLILVDVPPFGKSEKATSFTYSYENIANILLLLIRKMNIKKAVLVGHSMGGQIALIAARKSPHLVKKVILLCSSGYLPRTKGTLRLVTYLPFASFWIKNKLKKQGVRHNLDLCVSNKQIIDEEMVIGYEQPFSDDRIYRCLKKLAREREGDLSTHQLKKIQQPILILWGEEDKVVPLRIGRRLHNDLEKSKLVIFHKTGHLLPEEAPEKVAKEMLDFI
jgi:pimeloyl-ACP methyl ester carboxylesterase